MRILHVTHNFPRWTGDFSGNFLLALAREQVALGHEVTVVAPHATGAAERETVSGVEVRRFRYGPDADETLAYTGVMHEAVRRSWAARWRLVAFVRALRRMTSTVRRERGIDVVHLHWWFPAGMALWPSSAIGGVPALVTSHGTDLFMLRRLAALRGPARAILRRAAAVTTVSKALADEARALGVDASLVTVLPMPLDLETFGDQGGAMPPRDEDHVLFVGRLSAQKGVRDLLGAIARLAPDHPEIRLTVIGDGAERARLEQEAEALGIATRTRFEGTRSTGDVAAAYRRASVLAIPSTTGDAGEREGFGLVAVEAMLAGLPVVATTTGGLVDVIEDGVTGLLVPEREPARLALAIGRLLDDRIERAALAERGRVSATERFAPRAIAARYVALYQRVARGGAGSHPAG